MNICRDKKPRTSYRGKAKDKDRRQKTFAETAKDAQKAAEPYKVNKFEEDPEAYSAKVYALAIPPEDVKGRKYPYIPYSWIKIMPVDISLKGMHEDQVADIFLNKHLPLTNTDKSVYYYQAILQETHSFLIE